MKTFLENGLHEKIFAPKVAQNFSGKFGEIREKLFWIPQNLPAPTPMSRCPGSMSRRDRDSVARLRRSSWGLDVRKDRKIVH